MTSFKVRGVDVLVEGQGPDTLVFLHGWPDTSALWTDTVLALQPHFRCVRFTWPGFDKQNPLPPQSLNQLVQLVEDVIESVVGQASQGHQAAPKVSLVLHDWGCVFGYEYAARYPHRVQRIVAVDIGDHNSRALFESWKGKSMRAVFGYQIWLGIAWQISRWPLPFCKSVSNAMTRSMARSLRSPSPQSDMHSGMNSPYAMRWMGSLGGLGKMANVLKVHASSLPILYIYGKRKPFMFHSEEWLQKVAAHPGSRVEGFDTGHWVITSRSSQFHALVKEWLSADELNSVGG